LGKGPLGLAPPTLGVDILAVILEELVKFGVRFWNPVVAYTIAFLFVL
jgi:hypothetical protein